MCKYLVCFYVKISVTMYLVQKAYLAPARGSRMIVNSRLSPIKSLKIGDLKTGGPPFKNKDVDQDYCLNELKKHVKLTVS